MGELKPGWTRVKFGQIVRLNKDKSKDPEADGLKRYIGLEHIKPRDLGVRSWGDVAEGTTFTNRFSPGQVLFGKRRAYQRKVAVADFDGVCSGDIYVLEPKDPSVLHSEFLPFLCQTDAFFEHAVGTSAGSLSPRTNWKSLANYELALPPHDEQARIVRVLVAANNVVQTYEDAARYSRLAWQAAVDKDAGRWASVPFELLAEVITSGSRGWSKYYSPSGSRFLRVGNLRRTVFNLDLSELQHIDPPNDKEADRSRVQHDDLLVAVTGAYLGMVGLVDNPPVDSYVSQHVALIRLDGKKYTPRLAAHFLTGSAAQREVWRGNTGGTKPGLNLRRVGELPVPDIPYVQQIEVLEALDEAYAAIASLERRSTAASAAYKCLLQSAVVPT